MRKALTIIILAFLLSYINCDEDYEVDCENNPDYCYCIDDPKGLDDCKDRKLNNGEKYCCFMDDGDEKSCFPVTQEIYDKNKDTADEAGVKCENSNYIVISLLSLSLIILLL